MPQTDIGRLGDAILSWVRANLLDPGEESKVTRETNLLELGVLDSLKIAELVFFLESEHDIVIDTDEVETENFTSVSQIVQLAERFKNRHS